MKQIDAAYLDAPSPGDSGVTIYAPKDGGEFLIVEIG
jgi:hypothetical protein